ncbi:aminotransferase class I/II-fold pyridoxal phosphate-dependent enzyme [Kocuria coralli]|uniref:Aminotransferase class I/II-fold pyridoxal phosphate-dependent enzyme n=2 Tax=Kocuria coralli TaxID=1461025 RepID=A0A5J5L2I2_9MICC|nr:aminotransferase class I/II-fold pyridoxal phosphate-dependent enzyme [Kocuria coralli]
MASGGGLLDDAGAFRSTIFDETSALAAAHGAINLGQGFPDEDGPRFMLDEAVSAIGSGQNQYTAAVGSPRLRAAVAAQQLETQGRELDPDSQVLITVGAAEGLTASLLSVVSPGDDVVVLEPYYDLYAAVVSFAGANLRPVPLRPPHFAPDPDELRAAFTERTTAVLINDPHNPTGTVLDAGTARLLAELVVEHRAVLITDEVYEHLRFKGDHASLVALNERSLIDHDLAERLDERTLVVSSASKTLRATGWRIGWVTGPAELVTGARAIKTYLTHSPAAPLQAAVAAGLENLHPWAEDLAAEQGERSRLVVDTLRGLGLTVADPSGSYYVVADFTPLYERLGVTDSIGLSPALIEKAGVALLPIRAFASAGHAEQFDGWMRVAACKQPATLVEGMRRLREALG